jgi:hypothetical protein
VEDEWTNVPYYYYHEDDGSKFAVAAHFVDENKTLIYYFNGAWTTEESMLNQIKGIHLDVTYFLK